MRLIVILTFLFINLTSISLAQGSWGGGMPDASEQAERQTRLMQDSLHLSAAQTKHIAAVNATYALKQQEARDNSDGDFKSLRETMRLLEQEQDADLKTFLTSDQWTLWMQIRERQRQARMNRYRDRH